MRRVRTRVLPAPAAARMHSGADGEVTAARLRRGKARQQLLGAPSSALHPSDDTDRV